MKRTYRIVPNKGAGRSSKARPDVITLMLMFWAFQRWFQIENRTIIKDFGTILVIFVSQGLPQTIGGALIRGVTLNRDNTVVSNMIRWCWKQTW